MLKYRALPGCIIFFRHPAGVILCGVVVGDSTNGVTISFGDSEVVSPWETPCLFAPGTQYRHFADQTFASAADLFQRIGFNETPQPELLAALDGREIEILEHN